LKTIGLSVITDMCLPDALQPSNVDAIIATAHEAAPKLISIVRGICEELNQTRIA
jgi:purine-nucleoside phosphorylase